MTGKPQRPPSEQVRDDDRAGPDDAHRNLVARLAQGAGLTLVTPGELTIRRRRRGKGFVYLRPGGQTIRDPKTKARLDGLAVPPAYANTFFAADPAAHIQAIGTDEAGRLQYRYHPDWTEVREALKARRLMHLIEALPEMRRTVAKDLERGDASRRHALAAAVQLVERTAIRAGNAIYEKASGSRGAATLRKGDVTIEGDRIFLAFRAKGGKNVERQITEPKLARVLKRFMKLPGKRLFQFKDRAGKVRAISSADVNDYLKTASRRSISLKDFRTLVASSAAVEELAATEPARDERQRKAQINCAVKLVAEELANTPAVARKSYVHASVIDAFADGRLRRLAKQVKAKAFAPRRERLLLKVVKGALRRGRKPSPPAR